MPMVAPISPRSPVSFVRNFVSFETKKIIYAETDSSGTWSVIEMMTHKTAPATMMAVLILRALVGASSRLSQPSQSESIGRASTNVALILFRWRTFDDRDRGRAHAEKILVGIVDFDANRKALRDSDPV